MDKWMDGWMDRQMNGWMNKWMDGRKIVEIPHPIRSKLSIVHVDQEDRMLFESFSSIDWSISSIINNNNN